MSVFEHDGENSLANLRKHGIGFVAAQKLWQDPDLLEIQARPTDEPRCEAVHSLTRRIERIEQRLEWVDR